jgi:hypothetical protein
MLRRSLVEVAVTVKGGGRLVPPGAGATTTSSSPTGTTATDKTSAAKPPSTPPSAVKDGFDPSRPELRGPERASTTADAPSPSGVASMIRVLEDTRAKILDEHRELRTTIAQLVSELAARGFERAALEEHRGELLALRKRMAALRRRLHQIQRRLRTAPNGRVADVDLGAQLEPHLERLRSLEPGLQRALVALQMVELVCVEPSAGYSVTVQHDDRVAVGDELARALPGATIARGVAALLASAEGVALDETSGTPAASRRGDDVDAVGRQRDAAVARIAAIRDAIKASL